MDFWISEWISGFQIGFLDFTVDFWISGFQFGFLPTVYEISFVTDPSVLTQSDALALSLLLARSLMVGVHAKRVPLMPTHRSLAN